MRGAVTEVWRRSYRPENPPEPCLGVHFHPAIQSFIYTVDWFHQFRALCAVCVFVLPVVAPFGMRSFCPVVGWLCPWIYITERCMVTRILFYSVIEECDQSSVFALSEARLLCIV